MFHYSLGTLMIVAGVGPPVIAGFWFGWRTILVMSVGLALLALWYVISLTMARCIAWLVASVME